MIIADEEHDKKIRLIRAINQEFSGQMHKPVLDLIDVLINETRIDNDTAQGRQFLMNQGKVAAYMQLRAYIVKPLGGIENGKGTGS